MKKNHLPKISIITPTLNQGRFIEQTILSVLDQSYPNLEFIIMDGGSTDQTKQIVSKYSSRLRFISERDRGQSHALNKGISLSTGDIIGFINSDDYLLPGSLLAVASFFSSHKEVMWVTGKCHVVDEKNIEVRNVVTRYKNWFLLHMRYYWVLMVVQYISQPSTFWRRRVVEEVGMFDQSLHYDMDYEYWLRIGRQHALGYIDRYLSSYRVHTHSKAVVSPETQFRVEHEIVCRYTKNVLIRLMHMTHVRVALWVYRTWFLSS